MTDATVKQAAGIRRDELEVLIDAPVARVWQAMTGELSTWWPKHASASPNTRRMVFEPVLGGRLYEDAGDGHGLIWYTVIMIVPNKSLDLSGVVATRYGGPAQSLVYIELESRGDKTLLKLSDSRVGCIDECGTLDGWRKIFGDVFKPYAEGAKHDH